MFFSYNRKSDQIFWTGKQFTALFLTIRASVCCKIGTITNYKHKDTEIYQYLMCTYTLESAL